MARPRLPYLQHERSRLGESIWYVRVGTGPRVRIRAPYDSPEFGAEYRCAIAKVDRPTESARPTGKTLQWLWDEYRHSAAWKALAAPTRRARENIMLHVLETAGDKPFAAVTRKSIVAGRDRRADTPAMARVFVILMRGLFRWAVEAEHVESDPTRDVRAPALPTDGHHTWTAEEIAKFEKAHLVGSRERLAFDILLYTGLRRGDAARLGRQHVKGGIITLRTEKSGQTVEIAIHPALRRSIDATGCGDLTFIVGEAGRPMTKESFGNWFGEICADLELPGRAHGLRKALATKLAESGATEAELDAALAWRGGGMAALYTRKANRGKLSARAHARLAETEIATLHPRAGEKSSDEG